MAQSFIQSDERTSVAAVAALTECNPFVAERVELEKQVLGAAFQPTAVVWSAEGDEDLFDPNLPLLRDRVEALAKALHSRLEAGASATPEELADYGSLVLYLLWLRYEDRWLTLSDASEKASEEPGESASDPAPVEFYAEFAAEAAHFYRPLKGKKPKPAHLFALGFQVRRAFHHIFRKIFGASLPAAQLRARVWQSIFTHNITRYRTALYDSMADIPTLITGESGTGKELVARAIALSQYIPFDAESHTFVTDPARGFSAVNLAALSPTLIESELFGHRRGAFTGAVHDHAGWLERCHRRGAVFLDEIGELGAAIQVKLLRVLQDRKFQRIGDAETRTFAGKVILATNRDLDEEIAAHRFREDLYYRICADLIHMPTLREQLAANPHNLRHMIQIIARRVAGAAEGEFLAQEAYAYVVTHLGAQYAWRGNIRELEQCVRNVLISGEYRPRRTLLSQPDAADELAGSMRVGKVTADEMVKRYAALLYAQTGSFQEAARRLDMDWRTVRKLVGAAEWERDR